VNVEPVIVTCSLSDFALDAIKIAPPPDFTELLVNVDPLIVRSPPVKFSAPPVSPSLLENVDPLISAVTLLINASVVYTFIHPLYVSDWFPVHFKFEILMLLTTGPRSNMRR
jgi:hypothetical protein